MPTFNNGDSGNSIRTKLNTAITKIDDYDPDAVTAAAITAAENSVATITKQTLSFLPTLGFANTGNSSISYGSIQTGTAHRYDSVVTMSVVFDDVTITVGSGTGRLRLDFANSGLTASDVDGELGCLRIIEHDRFLDLPDNASDLRFIAVPGTQYFELAFSTPKLLERVNVYNLGTKFVLGEFVTGASSGETGRIKDIIYDSIAGSADIDQRLVLEDLTGPFTSNENITGNGGGNGSVGAAVTTVATGGTQYVNEEMVLDGTFTVKMLGDIFI